mgnify:CR=1 FL=1
MVLARAMAQLEGQLPEDVTKSPVYEPFTRMTLDASVKAHYQALGQAALREHFYPAQRRLLAVLKDELQPKAPESGSLSSYPGGTQVYDALILRNVTLPLAAGISDSDALKTMSCSTPTLARPLVPATLVNAVDPVPRLYATIVGANVSAVDVVVKVKLASATSRPLPEPSLMPTSSTL